DLEHIPFVSPEPISLRRRRRPFGSMIAAAGVSMMLLVGILAISALIGSGGANSPHGAVRRLADAMSNEGPPEAADVLAPNEVRSLSDTVDEASHKASELKIVSSSSAPLKGVDLDVKDLRLSTEELADGYAKVTIESGTLSASTTKAKFSALMQKVL